MSIPEAKDKYYELDQNARNLNILDEAVLAWGFFHLSEDQTPAFSTTKSYRDEKTGEMKLRRLPGLHDLENELRDYSPRMNNKDIKSGIPSSSDPGSFGPEQGLLL
ncbi:hypothetical protein T439DRAFT_333913 [Meredithblackwellia eburnea MCA 4105]